MFECDTFQDINWTHGGKLGIEGDRPEFVAHFYRLLLVLQAGREVSDYILRESITYLLPVQEKHEGRRCTNSPLRCQVSSHTDIDIDLCKPSSTFPILQSFLFSNTLEYGLNHLARRASFAGEKCYRGFMAFQEIVERSWIRDDVHRCSQRVGGMRNRLRGAIRLSIGSHCLENG